MSCSDCVVSAVLVPIIHDHRASSPNCLSKHRFTSDYTWHLELSVWFLLFKAPGYLSRSKRELHGRVQVTTIADMLSGTAGCLPEF